MGPRASTSTRAPGSLPSVEEDPPSDEAAPEPLPGHVLQDVLRTRVAAIVVCDPAGNIVFANERAERVLGLERSEIVQRAYDAPQWRHTDLEGRPLADEDQPFVRVMRTRAPVEDVRHGIEWPDGRRRFLSIHGEPILDAAGAVESVVFSVADITAQVESEAELARKSGMLELALDASRMGIWDWDVRGNRVRWSHLTCAIFARPLERGDLSLEEYVAYVHPEDRQRVEGIVREALVRGGDYQIEHRIVREDGVERMIEARGRVEQEAGAGVRILGTVLDVTERRRAEEQLSQASRLETIGRLAGGVVHDFNNLLTTIIGFTDLVRAELPQDSGAHHGLKPVLEAAERGAALTRRLLGFVRDRRAQPRLLATGELLEGSRLLLGRLLPEDIRLEWELEEHLPAVFADPLQVEQILINLVINARDATPAPGRIRVRASAVPAPTDGGTECLEVAVEDHGHGIPAELLERVFDPFFTTRPEGGGTGLGLAICREIVAELGGTIELESSPGSGTRVSFRLPAGASGAPEEAEPRQLSAPPEHGSETVLVAEDDASIRDMLGAALGQRGYRVLLARDGREALDLARDLARPVDLLLTDVVMPRMGGQELVRRMRELQPDLRILLSSGYEDPLGEALPEGCTLVPKPYSLEELTWLVRRALDDEL